MKATRIAVEGPNGTATLSRDGRRTHITGEHLVKAIAGSGGKVCLVKKPFRLLADAWGPNENVKVARRLQQHLDGEVGTIGDLAACRRVIEMLAD